VTFGRQSEEVVATELPAEERQRVALAYQAEAGREETRRRLERDVPVFRLTPG
jgi:hypothetical protein